MTGATGNLTPDDAEEPFVPAESRVVSDPDGQASAAATRPVVASDDPEPPPRESRIGGDELSDHDEHF